MASNIESIQNQPNHCYIVCMLYPDAGVDPSSDSPLGMHEIVATFTTLQAASNHARDLALEDQVQRYAVFECVQVFGATTKVDMLYSRRG